MPSSLSLIFYYLALLLVAVGNRVYIKYSRAICKVKYLELLRQKKNQKTTHTLVPKVTIKFLWITEKLPEKKMHWGRLFHFHNTQRNYKKVTKQLSSKQQNNKKLLELIFKPLKQIPEVVESG